MSAGKYEVTAHFWEQITSKPGQPLDYIRHRKGAVVELDDAAEIRRLVDAGAIKPVSKGARTSDSGKGDQSQGGSDSSEGGQSDDSGKPATAEEILADVGDDPDKAAAVLEVEKASDKPRSTLITKLEKVIEKASQAS